MLKLISKPPKREKSIVQTNKQIRKLSEKIKLQKVKTDNFKFKYGVASKNAINS